MYPFFDFDVIRNITTRVGQTTFLHCRVEQLGDKSVSCFVDKIKKITESGACSLYIQTELLLMLRGFCFKAKAEKTVINIF
jgi:hypothetical protein